MPEIDADALARDLLRALRGPRSREAMARRLGVSANAIYAWETGRRGPSAALFLRAAERCGVEVLPSLRRWLRQPDLFGDLCVTDAELMPALIGALKGSQKVTALAARVGLPRTALSRWLSGAASPRLAELLRVIEATNARTVEFVALFVPPDGIPALEGQWRQVRAARRLGAEAPWANALLVAMDTEAARSAPSHPPGFLGALAGLTPEQEEQATTLLEAAGLLQRQGERWTAAPRPPIALSSPEAQRASRAWSARQAALRLDEGQPGSFGFVVFTASAADLERLEALRKRFADEALAIILHPSGHEQVYALNLHIFPLARGGG